MNTNVNTLDNRVNSAQAPLPPIVYAAMASLAAILVGSAWLGVSIFQMAGMGNLGVPVKNFLGGVSLLPAIFALYGIVMLALKRPEGRYTAMGLLYLGLVVCLLALLTLWGVWDGFEFIVNGIMAQPWVLLGFALAYGLNWLSGRAKEGGTLHRLLQNGVLGLFMLALVLLLWFSGILNGISAALGTYTRFENGFSLASVGVQVWAATLGAVIFGGLAYAMLRLGLYFNETPFELEAWQGWLMLSPNIIGFVIFFAGPLLLSFYLSFTNDTIGNIPQFIGFRNYIDLVSLELQPLGEAAFAQNALSFGYQPLTTFNWGGETLVLGAKAPLFWISLGNTILFCLFLVPLSTIPAIGLAIVLNSKLPGMKFFRAVYFLPSVAAVVGTSLIWRWLYDPTVGFINYAISSLAGSRVNILWLTDPAVVLISIVLLAAWQVVGFNTVLFLAGLQGIPNVLYEAGMIDGANGWNRFRFITVPLLAPTTFFVVITTVITGLQVFNEPYTLFVARPIPTNATTSVYYMYTQGFLETKFGYASAIAWVLFAVIFTVTLIQFRIQRSED